MTDKGRVGPEPAESETLCETAEHETEVQNEDVTSASSATRQMSASISPSPAAATTSTLRGDRRSLSETSQPLLECYAAFSESASSEIANTGEATGSLSKVTGSSPKVAGSSLKAGGSSMKASGSSLKASGSSLKASGSSLKACGSPLKASSSSLKASSSSLNATASSLNATASSLNATASSLYATASSLYATASSLNATASSLNATASSLNATASSLNATASSLNATASSLNATASSLNATASSLNATWSSPMPIGTKPQAGGAIPRNQVSATKKDESRVALIQAAKEKATKSRKLRNGTRSRSRSGSSSDSTPQEDVIPSTGFSITPINSITIGRTGNLLIVPVELCKHVENLPVPKREREPMEIIVIHMEYEIEQYVTVLYKEYPPHENSSIRYFLLPVPDERVLASVQRNIVLHEIYIKREDNMNSTLAVTLWDKEGIRNITLAIYVESFVGATLPQPVFPEVQNICLARICSLRQDKESCTIQLHPAYVDIMTYVMTFFMNDALLNKPDVLPVTNPILGKVYIYLNNNTRIAFRAKLIDIEFDDDDGDDIPEDLVSTYGSQARGPEDSGIALRDTVVIPENLPIPSKDSGVTREGESKESEDKNERDLSYESIKHEQQIFKVKFIDYAVEAYVKAANMFEFASIHLLPLESMPPQGLEANVFQVGTIHDGLEDLLTYVMMRLIHIKVVDHGAVGSLPSVEVFDYVAQEHHVVRP